MARAIRKTGDQRFLSFVSYVFLAGTSFLCVFPFLIIIMGSLTSNAEITMTGYTLFPKKISLEAYQFIFRFPETVVRAYGVTVFNTVIGTVVGLFIIAMTGFVLQRQDCKYRNAVSFFIYFTTLFQGGMISWYILMTRYYHLQDNRLVLVLPMLMTPFLIILMKSFIKTSVPHEIVEAAIIDGANDFKIFTGIILHLATPGLAAIGLFLALAYWNDWFLTSLFISTQEKYSLQFYLYNMLNNTQAMRQMSQTGVAVGVIEAPTETVRMAMAVICTGPILFLYPWIQKYFVKGLTMGAVKG